MYRSGAVETREVEKGVSLTVEFFTYLCFVFFSTLPPDFRHISNAPELSSDY
jgi:hypothetical protein